MGRIPGTGRPVTTRYMRTKTAVHLVDCLQLRNARYTVPMDWADGLTIWEIEAQYRLTDPPYDSLPSYCSTCLPNCDGIRAWTRHGIGGR